MFFFCGSSLHPRIYFTIKPIFFLVRFVFFYYNLNHVFLLVLYMFLVLFVFFYNLVGLGITGATATLNGTRRGNRGTPPPCTISRTQTAGCSRQVSLCATHLFATSCLFTVVHRVLILTKRITFNTVPLFRSAQSLVFIMSWFEPREQHCQYSAVRASTIHQRARYAGTGVLNPQ